MAIAGSDSLLHTMTTELDNELKGMLECTLLCNSNQFQPKVQNSVQSKL